MDAFIQGLSEPGSWTETQWLAIAILVFVIVAAVYFVIRLYQIIRGAGKSTYKPNIGMSRLKAQGLEARRRERNDEDEG